MRDPIDLRRIAAIARGLDKTAAGLLFAPTPSQHYGTLRKAYGRGGWALMSHTAAELARGYEAQQDARLAALHASLNRLYDSGCDPFTPEAAKTGWLARLMRWVRGRFAAPPPAQSDCRAYSQSVLDRLVPGPFSRFL